ncbi:hypothetical protein [Cystobacter fuscus]|uniref:hypothetical protein n=1 Tax=Cystobacter fuscus TaxID=43 RepID=UPI0037C04C34
MSTKHASNPSGNSFSLDLRRELLEAAAREDFLLLEDNPYGLFHLPGPRRRAAAGE